jgi:hypothetical protein
MPPVLIDPVAIAAQDPLPLLKQGDTGRFGAMGVHERARHGVSGQGPPPWPGVVAVPGRCINVAAGGLARQGGNGRVVGHEGWRGAVNDLSPGAQTDRKVPAGLAEGLDETPGGPLHPGPLTEQGGQAGTRAGLRRTWPLGFEDLATARQEIYEQNKERWVR